MAEDSNLPHKLASLPMIHGVEEGVAELVWESGQPLARHPSRSRPSQLHRLKRPRLGFGANDLTGFEPHVVPQYRDLDHHHPSSGEAAAFNNELVPKVPDYQFNLGWGPFAQMLMDNPSPQQQQQQGTHSCSTDSTNCPNSSSRLDLLTKSSNGGKSSIPVESTLVESGSKSVKRFDLLAPPDEQSEAVSRDSDTRAKRAKIEANAAAGGDENPDHRKESACCSLAASNDFERLKNTHHEDTTETAQRGRKKKRRSAEVHNQSEKRRRAKINKKLQVLQDMIPNANKIDKASLLDEAIEYMKGLQLQLQIMAMGRGLMMQPMMLPGFQAPQMAQPPTMGMGMAMGMNTHMGLGCNPTPLSNSPLLGFPGQMLPLTMPQLQPFSAMPTGGSSSKPSIPMPAMELMGSAPFLGTRDATFQGTNPEMLNMEDQKDG
ncbi:unnamed protein product [Linum trigynum]|uniref:BHLH domain-containing protein n=1 Tax=Linum trigynum TaxID=586398 RepID=A0AAV2FKD4_9ROSI